MENHSPAGENVKRLSGLKPSNFERHPVWEFANDLEHATAGDSLIRPYTVLPVSDLGNRIVGTDGLLANGSRVPILLQNVDLESDFKTSHFITLTFFNESGDRFPLARYFDAAWHRYGPEQLAEFMGLKVDEIFPVAFDITGFAMGLHDVLRRSVPAMPRKRLSSSEIIELALQ